MIKKKIQNDKNCQNARLISKMNWISWKYKLHTAGVKHATNTILCNVNNRACYVICLSPNLTHPPLGANPTQPLPFPPRKPNLGIFLLIVCVVGIWTHHHLQRSFCSSCKLLCNLSLMCWLWCNPNHHI
jgi:hypothetical protein